MEIILTTPSVKFVHDFTSTNLSVLCFKNDHQGKQINMEFLSTVYQQ